MPVVVPDIEWYLGNSRNRGVLAPRCPYSTAHSCPRYYQSLSLLGYAGSTKIDKKDDDILLNKWEKTDLWPITKEQETSLFGIGDKISQYINFCPEVTYERFGYFASDLGRYSDDIDREYVLKSLEQDEMLKENDWRPQWSYVQPQHYCDCPLYSVLAHREGNATALENLPEIHWYQRPLGIILLGVIVTVIGGLIIGLF